ncbi:MAG: SulP family inorganic anion transporter [Solirubrobacterales bacterium]
MVESSFARLRALLPDRADLQAAGRSPQKDLLAGATVAIVALPLALAFGVTSGLGAQAGIATAVIAGAVAAVFGGSNLQVSGPTGAMTVVLVPVVHQFGAGGVLFVGLLAGLVLIAMAFAGLGQYVKFLPLPVIEGFTAGIAVVIALQQVPSALGVVPGDQERVWAVAASAVSEFVAEPHLAPLAVTAMVAAVMLAGARWRPGIPFSILGVIAATLAATLLPLGLTSLGALPAGLPSPSLGFIDLGAIGSLLPAVIAVAALAALESLLSATVADGMSVDERHDPDRELMGQGLANLAAPVFGGIPATAAIARTAVNVRAGASSKLAALSHSMFLLAVVLVAAPLVSEIPLAALAGVLVATTVQMIDTSSVRALARASRGDAFVLFLTFSITVAFDLVAAVVVGLGVAIIIALRSVAKSVRVDRVPLERGSHTDEEHELLSEHIVAYRLDGPLFFGASHRFLLELTNVADVKVVILRMSRVTTMDATGGRILGDAITRIERRGIVVLVSGISPDHDDILKSLGVADHLRQNGRIFPETPEAIEYARRLVPSLTPKAHPRSVSSAD